MPLPERTAAEIPMPTRLAEPGGVLWEGAGLVTFTFSNGSAFLLQTMEPTIAAVLEKHSVFRTDPVGRGMRSIASVMMWIYADEESLVEVERLRQLHAPLDAVDADGVRHTALSSGPWAWVLLTGMHAFVSATQVFGAITDDDDVEAVFEEMKQLMRGFRVAEKEIPATYDDFVAHFDKVVTEHLRDTRMARDFLEGSRHPGPPLGLPTWLHPVWRVALSPMGYFQHLAILGMAPAAARRTLGVKWGRWQDLQLKVFGRTVGTIVPLLPERLIYFPIAYEARRLERLRRERPGDTRAIARAERRLRRVIEKRPT
jgi:uncharacterized protein (DUF2236 family)